MEAITVKLGKNPDGQPHMIARRGSKWRSSKWRDELTFEDNAELAVYEFLRALDQKYLRGRWYRGTLGSGVIVYVQVRKEGLRKF